MRPTSVIVVSRHRPQAIDRCLTSLSQLSHDNFEIVVVCDPQTREALSARNDFDRLKVETFDAANISAARNIGIRQAAGEIVAFIDDDSVAEPLWLNRLTDPFDDSDVTATGGFVRGRNGVSFQWRASQADAAGRAFHLPHDAALNHGRVWRTEGTNMAFRREPLIACGGFDEAFWFYLDETDLNRRLPGHTVIVPQAEVHHGYLPSARRRQDRVPKDLTQIAASTAVFLRKHAPAEMATRLDEVRRLQRARCLRHMVDGRLEPRDIKRLMRGFEAGLEHGAGRESRYLPQTLPSAPAFKPYRSGDAPEAIVITGPGSQRDTLLETAAQAATEKRPTVIVFHRDARYLKVSFDRRGFWLHEGGQYGRGERSDPLIRRCSLKERIDSELKRVSVLRDGI